MFVTMLKSKIHRATVTEADLHYEGSISIDTALMAKAGLLCNEQVDVYNINNGERFTTYAIPAPANSGTITINGAAARLAAPGDLVIICAYIQMEAERAASYTPTLVFVDAANKEKHHG